MDPLTIAFTPTIFVSQRAGGISRYFSSLIEELTLLGVRATVPGLLHQNEYLSRAPFRATSPYYAPLTALRLATVATIAHRVTLPWSRAMRKAQCVHETYYHIPPLHRSQRCVVTVYDMIHEMFPEQVAAGDTTSARKAQAVERADRVICISHRTAADLCERFPRVADKVAVVHLGWRLMNTKAESLDHGSDSRPYLLFVGERRGYKNFDGLVRAFAASRALTGDFRIRVFGGGPLTAAERRLIAGLGLPPGDVEHSGYQDADLAHLYRHAAALVYPSRYEGFGLPVVEAMGNDCPVICSKGGSLPEVGGSAAEYFDPDSQDDIARAIEAVMYSPVRRKELVELGRAQSLRFSWTRCAEETLAIYRSLV